MKLTQEPGGCVKEAIYVGPPPPACQYTGGVPPAPRSAERVRLPETAAGPVLRRGEYSFRKRKPVLDFGETKQTDTCMLRQEWGS
jgi:hypothetical protein